MINKDRIKYWYAADKQILEIEKMPLSRLLHIIALLQTKCAHSPNAYWGSKGQYPKGTTVLTMLKVMEEERLNRRLRKNKDLFS